MRAKKLFPELTFKRLWNKITGVESRVDELKPSHAFAKGTYEDITLEGVYGFITTSSTQICLHIPVIFERDISKCQIIKLVVSLRTVTGAYVISAGTDITSYISYSTLKREQGILRITLTKSDGWGITNNTPICGIADKMSFIFE